MRWKVWLLLLPVLAVGAVIGMAYTYLASTDFERVRLEIEEALEERLGREVKIAGGFEVQVLPIPTVGIRQVSVANADWGSQPQMLEIDLLELQLGLVRLALGEIEIRQLMLYGARLWLENNSTGTYNWDFESRREDEPGDAELDVRAVEVRDFSVTYFNVDTGITRETVLDLLEVETPELDEKIQLQAIARLPDGARLRLDGGTSAIRQLLSTGGFEFDLRVRSDDDEIEIRGSILDQDFTDFSGTRLSLRGAGSDLQWLRAWLDFELPRVERYEFRAELRGEPGGLYVDQLISSIAGEGFNASLDGTVAALDRLEGFNLRLSSEGRTIRDLIPAWDWAWTETEQYQFRATLLGSSRVPQLEDLHLHASVPQADLTISGRIGDSRDMSDIALTGTFEAVGIGALVDVFLLPIPDVDRIVATMAISGHQAEMRVTDLDGTLYKGSSTGRLRGTIEDAYELSGVDMTFVLEGNDLRDLTSLLPDPLPVEVPQTKSYSAMGRVAGSQQKLSLVLDSATAQSDVLTLDVSGTVNDLLDVPDYSLLATVAGADLRDLSVPADWNLPPTDGFQVKTRISGTGDIVDVEVLDATVRGELADGQFSGRLEDVLHSRGFAMQGSVSGKDLAAVGAWVGAELPATESFSLSATAGGAWDAPVLRDIQGQVTASDLSVQLSGEIGNILGVEDFEIDIRGTAESLVPRLSLTGDVWRHLGKVETGFHISGGPQYYQLDFDRLAASGSRLSGSLNVRLKDGKVARIRGGINEGVVDIGPWLKNSAGDGTDSIGAGAQEASVSLFERTELDLDWLGALTVDFDLAGLTLTVGGEPIAVREGWLRIHDGVFDLDPLEASYRDAEVLAGVRLQKGRPARLDAWVETTQLDVGRLLRLSGIDESAEGLIDFGAQIETQGNSTHDMAAAANGRVALLMTEGSVRNQTAGLTWVRVLGDLLPWQQKDDEMVILCGIFDMPIVEGRGRLNVFVVDTPNMLMRGEGRLDFDTETVDVLLRPRPKKGKTFSHNVNIAVVGPLAAPAFRLQARDAGRKVASSIGKFVLLGPGGLLLSADTFKSTRHDCASTLEEVRQLN